VRHRSQRNHNGNRTLSDAQGIQFLILIDFSCRQSHLHCINRTEQLSSEIWKIGVSTALSIFHFQWKLKKTTVETSESSSAQLS